MVKKTNPVPYAKYYFNRPELWEALNEHRYKPEVDFLQGVFSEYISGRNLSGENVLGGNVSGGNYLDIGCGTGGHLQEFANRGFTGTGIDLNENLLEFARSRNLDQKGISFDRVDMRNMPYEGKFDAAFSLCTTFAYNLTVEDINSAFTSINRALKPGGVILIETFNPISWVGAVDEALKFKPHLEEVGRNKEIYAGFGLRSECDHEIDNVNQHMIETRTVYDVKSENVVKSDVTRFRLFFPQEMRTYMEMNGFKFQRFYGAYKSEDMQDNEERELRKFRLIAVGTKR